jgi:DNA-binding NtrC family response regulator
VATNAYDVIFLDVRLPDGIGLDAIQKIKANSSAPEVVIITGEGDPNGAELAIQYGAWDYIEKPPSVQSVILPLVRALQYRTEKKDAQKPLMIKRDNIIGNSPQLLRSLKKLARAAQSQASVLIEGETGTGKELFAMAIHQSSSRSGKNFVVVDCAALPETLVESVLFGHAKGAFTGADQAKEGLVKQADQGTLFLDEIGELPLSLQKAFLRVLQEQRFRPIGGGSEVNSDFRLIAATNRDLDRMVQEKQFRQDLLFRIRSLVITLPPLRERPEDINQGAFTRLYRGAVDV